MDKAFVVLLLSTPIFTFGQSISEGDQSHIESKADDFPALVMSEIPGAPTLGKPILLMGELKPVMGEGRGWAAPAVYDWNQDGKKDLLIGEFGSGAENKQIVGNLVRIYTNIGTDAEPKFTDDFKYLSHPFGTGNGTPLSVFTWCCMAIRPQFIDLDNDGFQDLLTGQYNPGEVTIFRGSKEGFLPGEKVIQEGNPAANNQKLPVTDINSLWYWNYSTVSFGDFDQDGDFDMIVGGSALRISENTGTKTHPRYGTRELLLDINEKPLVVYNSSVKKETEPYEINPAGTFDATPLVVDWDNDGVLDLFVTTGYYKADQAAITFFRGVKREGGFRFEPGVALFRAKDGGKDFPGSWIRVFVIDWNNDGIKDLLIGTSVATIDGVFNYKLSWTWEDETGIVKKNPALYDNETKRTIGSQIAEAEKHAREAKNSDSKRLTKNDILKHYYGNENYYSLAHKGYIYLLLGK